MGITRNTKADKLATQAREAYVNGQHVFAALMNTPTFTMGLSGEIPDWSAMIEAVEREGWILIQYGAAVDHKGNPQAYPVFRRR